MLERISMTKRGRFDTGRGEREAGNGDAELLTPETL